MLQQVVGLALESPHSLCLVWVSGSLALLYCKSVGTSEVDMKKVWVEHNELGHAWRVDKSIAGAASYTT